MFRAVSVCISGLPPANRGILSYRKRRGQLSEDFLERAGEVREVFIAAGGGGIAHLHSALYQPSGFCAAYEIDRFDDRLSGDCLE